MGYQMFFERYEQKYVLTYEQKLFLLEIIQPYMNIDQYGRTTIRNIYFDTENYLLIRRSIEKPVYKEKLRFRSYKQTLPDDNVFVELKKKYNSVIYKVRVELPEQQAKNFICGNREVPDQTQRVKEIVYFRDFYRTLRPVVFLAYEREAYYNRDGGDFRITFDENLRARTTEFIMRENDFGTPLLEEGAVLMEIKTAGGIPLWLAQILSEQRIFCRPFSKYGEAYRQLVFRSVKGGIRDA